MKKGYCFECEAYVDLDVVQEEEEFYVKETRLKANQKNCSCRVCGTIALNKDIELENETIAYDTYRKIHGIPKGQSIREHKV